MDASGNRAVADSANTSDNGSIFPSVFLTKGPCNKLPVTTYVFYTYAESVKQYEEIFNQLVDNKREEDSDCRFVMCRAEVDESSRVKALGMVQFWKQRFVISEMVYKNILKRMLDASSGIPFFHKIEDRHVKGVYEWLHEGRGKIFKHGVADAYHKLRRGKRRLSGKLI